MTLSQFFARSSVIWGLIISLLLPVTGGCGQPTEGRPNVIKIVSSLPRTGSARAQTDTIVNGIRMALEEADMQVGEFTLEYDDWDDATAAQGQWTAEAEARNANRAVSDPDVMAYIGTYNSGAAKVAMPILNRASLLMISPANTSVELTKPELAGPNETKGYRPTGKVTYFRVIPTDDLQGSAGAEWAKEMGVKSVYVLHDNQVYGKGLATFFRAQCEEIGITVLGEDGIDTNIQDFKPLMFGIKAQNPDLIYFGGTTQSKAGQIAKDLIAAGLNAKLMVPDGCYEEVFISSAGAENVNDRCFVTFGGLPPDQMKGAGAEFVEKYRKKYDSDPEAYAVYGYECAKVVIEAIRQDGKKDRAAIVEACQSLKSFEAALGPYSFDENGDTTLRQMSGVTIRDGKFEFVKLLYTGDNSNDAAGPGSGQSDDAEKSAQ